MNINIKSAAIQKNEFGLKQTFLMQALVGQAFLGQMFRAVLFPMLFIFFSIIFNNGAVKAAEPDAFIELSQKLITKSYKDKEATIKQLVVMKDDRVLLLLQNLLKSKLYYLKENKQLVYATKQDGSFTITDINDLAKHTAIEKSKIKKVKTNNKIRKILRTELAKLNLQNEDSDIRYRAVLEMFKTLDDGSIALLKSRLPHEPNDKIKSVIEVAIATKAVNDGPIESRLKAIQILGSSLYPRAKSSLENIINRAQISKTDKTIHIAAIKALEKITTKVRIAKFAETIFFGLSLGSVLLLAAIGLSITFGVMGVINMAHGELIMLGAYTTYFVQLLFPQLIEYSLFISIPAAFIVSGLFGIAIERGVIRFLYGRPLETLLATFGVSLMLQQLVRTTISAQNVIVTTPVWMSGSLQINPILSITYNRLYIVIFSLLVFFSLLYILNKTVLGLQIRAVSQNRNMAKAMGIRSNWVDALTFGLGSGIAGITGVALSQLTNVGPNLGQAYIIDSFMVVVFGGVGNLWGTLVGALSLGVLNKFLEPFAGAVLAKILVLIFIILFIQKKPRGLFPKKGRSAED